MSNTVHIVRERTRCIRNVVAETYFIGEVLSRFDRGKLSTDHNSVYGIIPIEASA